MPTQLQNDTTTTAGAAGDFWEVKTAVLCDGQWQDVQPTTAAAGSTLDLKVDAGQLPSTPSRVRVSVSLPLLNFARVIIPDCGRHYINSMKSLDIRAAIFKIVAPNAGHPFFALMDEADRFYFSFGLLDAPGEVEIRRILPVISTRKAMVGGDNDLLLTFEWAPQFAADGSLKLGCYVNHTHATWFDALRDYTNTIKQRENITYPNHPDGWEPVWCTWTAFPSYEMNEERVLENARIAKELGMGTIILDDGWFGPGLDDDVYSPINHGDYQPDPRKFDDMKRTIRKIQDLDLKFLLWHAPLCVAPKAKRHTTLNHLLMRTGEKKDIFLSVNGMAQLCPCCRESREVVAKEISDLIRQYGIDGYKIDLYNCLPDVHCTSTDHEHDIADPVEAVDATMKAVWDAAREVKPDILVELKQDYGNVRLIRHGTMVRAGDTAYDMDTNALRCAYTQAFAQCVHVDPLVTSTRTTPLGMSLLVMKNISMGVPTFSIDLAALDEPLRQVMATWLKVYNDNRATFMTPRRPQNNAVTVWVVGDEKTSILTALRDAYEIELPKAKRVLVLNASARDRLWLTEPLTGKVQMREFNHFGKCVREQTLKAGETLQQLPVGVGGWIELQR